MDAYTFILKFAGEHWFQTFCAWWVICFMAYLLAAIIEDVLNVARSLVARAYRVVTVLFRGWPPEHLDADGDFRPTEKGSAK